MSNFRKFVSVSAVAILGASNLLMPLSYASAADVNNYDAAGTVISTAESFSFVMPNRDVFLKAYTEANHYFVDYYGNTHTSGSMPRSEFVYDQEGELSGNAFAKVGYTFSGWNKQADGGGTSYANKAKVLNWTTESGGIVNIYAQWNVNSYNIEYDLNDSAGTSSGVHSLTPSSLPYDETGTIAKPSRTGYTFSGWNITNMDSNPHIVGGQASNATTANGVMGTSFKNLNATNDATVKFLATWTKNTDTKYKVEHYTENLDGQNWTLVQTDNLTGTTDTEVRPSVHTYEGFTKTANTPHSGNINADGNTVFRYKYTRNSYNLKLIAGRGINSVKGTGTVNTTGGSANADQNTTISFKYDEPVALSFTLKPGYENGVWSGYSGTASAFNMPASNQEKTAYATPIDYHLTVNPRGGAGATGSRTYTVEDDDIPLGNPTRDHSTFEGWTGGVDGQGITSPTKGVVVTGGSLYDREYSAVWSCVTGYHIEGTGTDVESCEADTNTRYLVNHVQEDLDGQYTIYIDAGYAYGITNTNTILTGNSYVGFKLHGNIDDYKENIEPDGSTVVSIFYDRLSYAGTIENPASVEARSITATAEGDHDTEVEGTYMFEDKVTLSGTLADGYTFVRWTVKDASGANVTVTNPTSLTNATFNMPASAVTITPEVTKIGYTISYELHSGSVATANKTGYNVETPNFTLTNPTRDHSDFVGWSGGVIGEQPTTSASVTIAKGSTGNRSYEAVWKCVTGYHANGANECVANSYTVTVDYQDGGNGGETRTEQIPFTYDTTGTIQNPQQSGYDFAGWIVTGLSGGNATVDGHPITNDSTTSGTKFNNLTTEQNGNTVTLTATWTPRSDTKFTVYHYYEDLNADTYTLSGTDVYNTGVTASTITLRDYKKDKTGFTYAGGFTGGGINHPDTSEAKLTTIINKDGSTKIYLYYQRFTGYVYLSGDEHIARLSWTGRSATTFDYGHEVTVEATAGDGYHFKQWRRKTDDTFATDY